eukprot:4683075-Prymnesium_polylepis.1
MQRSDGPAENVVRRASSAPVVTLSCAYRAIVDRRVKVSLLQRQRWPLPERRKAASSDGAKVMYGRPGHRVGVVGTSVVYHTADGKGLTSQLQLDPPPLARRPQLRRRPPVSLAQTDRAQAGRRSLPQPRRQRRQPARPDARVGVEVQE